MRTADETETLAWHGHEVTVETWFEACDQPWDGDGEAPDCEGVDLLVEVTLCPDSHNFKAYSSLGGVYGDNAYVRGCVAELVQESLEGLQAELEAVATGRDVRAAQDRQAIARGLLKGAS